MGNIVKFSTPVSANSIKSGGFNIGVNGTPTDLTGFYTGICPINGGYTIYIDKSENGPSIYTPNNDTQLINITKGLGGDVTTAGEALLWINAQSNMTVVNSNYPSIVTNGLVVNLDAGFVSSYPRNGTSWNDLSGSSNTGTLVNGPSFQTLNINSIRFDGINDYCDVFFNGRSQSVNTIEMFFRWRANNNTGMFIGFNGYDVWTSGGRLGFNTASSDLWGIASTVINQLGLIGTGDQNWHHYVFVFSNQVQNNKIYIDGILQTLSQQQGTTNLTSIRSFSSTFRLSGWPNSTGYIINGDYSYLRAYNRELTQQEILQNYYAGLQKFIPTNGLVLSLDAQNTNLYATSATTAYDISGNGNNGVLLNGTQYVGNADGSWRFDGIDDYINCSNSSTFNVNEFSAGFWVNLSISSTKEIFLKNNNTNNGIGPIEIFQSGRRISHRVNGVLVSGTTDLILGKWYLITLTYNQVNKILYINETQETSHSYSIPLNISTGNLTIGAYGNGQYPFNGNISEVFLYSRALSQTEIAIIYNAKKSRYGL